MNEQILVILTSIGIPLAVILLVFTGIVSFVRRTVTATVAGFNWQRQINIEHFTWVEESSYKNFPPGSRNQETKQESYRSHEYVRTETRTKWDGERDVTVSEPVYEYVTRYRTKYIYQIKKLGKTRTVSSEGLGRTGLHWPTYTLNPSIEERVRNQQEKYTVVFRDAKGKRYQRMYPEDEWMAFNEAGTYTLRTNLFGQVMGVIPKQEEMAVSLPEQSM